MIFRYNSSQTGKKKVLSDDLVSSIRSFLLKEGYSSSWELGELHDCLLRYRTHHGQRLMIHQLEPIFIYLAAMRRVWHE